LGGNGAAAINDLMEDAATAEISRSQLWQWRMAGVTLDDGTPLDGERYRVIRDEELVRLGSRAAGRLAEAADLLDGLVLDQAFADFLTVPAYPLLDR
jgi:Malate synthase